MCMLHTLHTCVWGVCVCACMCQCVHCRGYVSSASVAPGEIYGVLRMLASSPVMGDWSHLLTLPVPPPNTPPGPDSKTHELTDIHMSTQLQKRPLTHTHTCTCNPWTWSVRLSLHHPPTQTLKDSLPGAETHLEYPLYPVTQPPTVFLPPLMKSLIFCAAIRQVHILLVGTTEPKDRFDSKTRLENTSKGQSWSQ